MQDESIQIKVFFSAVSSAIFQISVKLSGLYSESQIPIKKMSRATIQS